MESYKSLNHSTTFYHFLKLDFHTVIYILPCVFRDLSSNSLPMQAFNHRNTVYFSLLSGINKILGIFLEKSLYPIPFHTFHAKYIGGQESGCEANWLSLIYPVDHS